ncbi:MAG: PspC domain-containing protein [Bacteroidetes bacterium]|nr:PspC domain-containing protein [Bacteroidota bacterium]
MPDSKKLYRSKSNKVIAGVCGGLAEFIGVDPAFVRILWVLLTLLGGSGVLLYIIAYLIMPENPEPSQSAIVETNSNFKTIIGALLVFLGVVLLADTVGLFSFSDLWRKSWEYILPICLIVIGIILLLRRKIISQQSVTSEIPSQVEGVEPPPLQQQGAEEYERLMRSNTDKKIFGICGGISEYFHIDSTIVRILYILFTFATGGVGVILYFLMALVIPQKQESSEQ